MRMPFNSFLGIEAAATTTFDDGYDAAPCDDI